MDDTDNICFVCDKTIPSDKWKYKLQVTATKRRNVPVADLIKQLVGEEYAVLVGERDAVCSKCMNLLNSMDSLTVQLQDVTTVLTQLLHFKYGLTVESTKFQVEYDEVREEIEPLHRCDNCSFQTKYEKEFNKHIRTHATPYSQSTVKSPPTQKPPPASKPLPTPKPLNVKSKTKSTKSALGNSLKPSPSTPNIKFSKPIGKKTSKKSPALTPKITQKKKTVKPKRTKVVFQCSICNKIFQSESSIKMHAKRVHGNDKIVVSEGEDEYEDIQTLESSDEETSKTVETKKSNKTLTQPKLDFLDDWNEEDNDTFDLSHPAKKQKTDSNKLQVSQKKSGREKRMSVESSDEDYDDQDTSSYPTCLFCHAQFSSFESVQDHIKLSHSDKTSHLNIKSKSITDSPGSVASFEIDSTTDIAEQKKEAIVGSSSGCPSKSYKCNLCGIKKVSLQFIKQHIKAHKRKLSMQCKFCGVSFKSIIALKVHASKCNKVSSISKKCSYCKFKFFNNVQLSNHIKKVHNKELLKNIKYLSKDLLGSSASDNSEKTKSRPLRYVQKNANKKSVLSAVDSSKISFSEVSSTSLENDSEPMSVKYSSEYVASSGSGIKRHIEKNQGTDEDKNKEEVLKLSLSKVGGKAKLECLECNIKFPKPSRLADHMNRHKATNCLNLGICIYCDRLFMDKDHAVIHTNTIHENLKTEPKCTGCSKVYSQVKDMKSHFLKAHFSEKAEKLMKQVSEYKKKQECSATSVTDDANDVYSKVFKELQYLTGEGNDVDDMSTDSSSRVKPLTYSCPLCDFDSTNQQIVRDHLSSHPQNYCNICKNIFTPQESIRHIENHSIEFQDKKCSECENGFHDDVHLQFHIQTAHPDRKPHKCSMCVKSYFTAKSMLSHKQTKHGKTSKKGFTCSECKMKFFSEKLYETHKEFAHRQSLNCKYCDKAFGEIKKLVFHEKNHLKQVKSIYKCNTCGKVLKTQAALKTHKINHASNNSLQCEVCSQKFKSFHSLREHSATHSEAQEKKYFCDICGKGFYFYDSHYRHRRIHLDPLLFQCKVCRDRFQTKLKLLEHMKDCTVPAPSKCSKCLKSFKTSSDLKKHTCLHSKKVAFS